MLQIFWREIILFISSHIEPVLFYVPAIFIRRIYIFSIKNRRGNWKRKVRLIPFYSFTEFPLC